MRGAGLEAAPERTKRLALLTEAARLTPWSRRERLAFGALAGLVATGIAIVLGSASTQPSFPIPSDTQGVPGWVAGPLASHGATMTTAEFMVLLGAMWVFYLVVLAFADAV